MASGLLDEGAGELDSQAFRTELEDLAIRLSFDAGRDEFTGQLKTLTEHRERAFELLRLALTEPRFDAEPVERIRNQIQANLRRRAEDPDYVAGADLVRRPRSPTIPTAGRCRARSRASRRSSGPTSRGFVDTPPRQGQSDRRRRGRRHGGGAGAAARPRVRRPARPRRAVRARADPTPTGGGTVVVRKDVPQSQVLFGQAGLPRDDPDFYAAYVTNHILGGSGFTSRLTEEVREKRGLAYSVYSYLYPLDPAPLWLGGLGTANAAVGAGDRRWCAQRDRRDGGGRDQPGRARRRQDLSDRLLPAAPDQQRRRSPRRS